MILSDFRSTAVSESVDPSPLSLLYRTKRMTRIKSMPRVKLRIIAAHVHVHALTAIPNAIRLGRRGGPATLKNPANLRPLEQGQRRQSPKPKLTARRLLDKVRWLQPASLAQKCHLTLQP